MNYTFPGGKKGQIRAYKFLLKHRSIKESGMVKRTLFVLDMTLDFFKNLPPVEESSNPGLANNGYYGCKEAAERPHSSVY